MASMLTARPRTVSSIISIVVVGLAVGVCVLLLNNPLAPRRTSLWLGLTALVLVRPHLFHSTLLH